jgi:hypothetical protein
MVSEDLPACVQENHTLCRVLPQSFASENGPTFIIWPPIASIAAPSALRHEEDPHIPHSFLTSFPYLKCSCWWDELSSSCQDEFWMNIAFCALREVRASP